MSLHLLIAYLLLALAQISIGVNVVAAKFVIAEMPVFLFLGLRFLFASIMLTMLTVSLRQPVLSAFHPTGRLQKQDIGFLFAQALTGGFLFNFFFLWGMEYTTATAAGIISSTLPAMITVCAYFFLKERLSTNKVIAIILAILGIVVISVDSTHVKESDHVRNFLGDFLVLCAMVPEALYSIFNKYVGKRFNPLGSATVVNWMIFLMLLPLAAFEYESLHLNYSWVIWALLLLCSLCCMAFYWAWPKGLLWVNANTAAIFGGIVPVVTALLGWFFLKEDFGWFDFTGMVLVIASIFVGIEYGTRLVNR